MTRPPPSAPLRLLTPLWIESQREAALRRRALSTRRQRWLFPFLTTLAVFALRYLLVFTATL